MEGIIYLPFSSSGPWANHPKVFAHLKFPGKAEHLMSLAIKISLAASGIFLMSGLLTGILKYRGIMTSEEHRAPVYIDIAHRASFLYSFAALVIAKLLEYSPYSQTVQVWAAVLPLAFFAITILGYTLTGLQNRTDNLFRERNFTTTWYMYALILAEIGGFAIILWGFLSTQILKV
ncbi:MAG TPA: hypothetical protein VGB17_05160 [Pyrinomonadaceae bacterium]|jgi:hypothetical protein